MPHGPGAGATRACPSWGLCFRAVCCSYTHGLSTVAPVQTGVAVVRPWPHALGVRAGDSVSSNIRTTAVQTTLHVPAILRCIAVRRSWLWPSAPTSNRVCV